MIDPASVLYGFIIGAALFTLRHNDRMRRAADALLVTKRRSAMAATPAAAPGPAVDEWQANDPAPEATRSRFPPDSRDREADYEKVMRRTVRPVLLEDITSGS